MRFTHLIGLITIGSGIALAAVACDSDVSGEDAAGTASGGQGPGPAGPTPTGTGAMGTGGMPDEGTSCDDAIVMTQAANGQWESDGTINPAGDTDFFKFDVAAADTWFAIYTEANPNDDPMLIDTVVTLLSEDGQTQLAEVDDSFPRLNTDTEIFHRFIAPGTYCVKVQEFSTWNQMTAEGSETFTYAINALPVDPEMFLGYTVDNGDNDTLASPQPEPHNYSADMTTMQVFTRFMGTLDPGTDTDVYAITTPPGALSLSFDLTPWGNGSGGEQGYGSTTSLGQVTLYDATGTTVISRVDGVNFREGLERMYFINPLVPSLENTDYLLEIKRPNDMVGTNDFYLLKYATSNVVNEQEDIANDAGNGNPSPMFHEVSVATPDGMVNRHFIGGVLTAGDIDYWTFDPAAPPQAGQTLILSCSSRSSGSGVTDMEITLEKFDTMGNVVTSIQTQLEDPNKGFAWTESTDPDATAPSVALADTGPFRLKIEATNVDPTITSRFYLCGVHVGMFAN